MEVFIGSVMTFPFSYAPYNWSLCGGQLVPLRQYTALFSLLGNIYGGDGQTTFGLPNLQSRIPTNQGTGAGLKPKALGDALGAETLQLSLANLPAHTHAAALGSLKPITTVTLANPTNNPQPVPSDTNAWIGASTPGTDGSATIFSTDKGTTPVEQSGIETIIAPNPGITLANTGSSAAFSILNPFLVVNFSIAMQGIFPSRN